jgi:hypothetical protein
MTEVADGDGTLVPEMVPKTDTTVVVGATTSLTTGEVATGSPAASTGLMADAPSSPPWIVVATALVGADDNAIEEPKVIMGHPNPWALGQVSLSEVMGTGHFTLNQVHDMLHHEREDIDEERLRLSVQSSLLKKWTTSEKEKAVATRKQLAMMQILLDRERVAIDLLNANDQQLMVGAKDLYVTVEAHAEATIKQQADLNTRASVMAQWEEAVADRELMLREEEHVDLRLDHELETLAPHESDLDCCEATLAAERKSLEEACAGVLARELAADISDIHLNSREEELADRKKRLAEQQPQELATAQKRLEEHQATQAGEAQKV